MICNCEQPGIIDPLDVDATNIAGLMTHDECRSALVTHLVGNGSERAAQGVEAATTLDPASPSKPSPTVQSKWFKGGAEGLLDVTGAEWKRKGDLWVRRLTPDECARLQSMPDDFAWPEGISKTAKYRIIGNGWASGIAWHLSQALADADPDSRAVADLFCGGGAGAVGWHGRRWSYEQVIGGAA